MTTATATATPSRQRRLRPRPVAACIALAFGGAGLAQAQAPAADRLVIRADPAARIFPEWRPDLGGLNGGSSNPPGATLPVSSCADDGPGTLRSVVAGAGEGDIVDLSALTCGVITLTTGAIPVMLNDLDILGPGADRLGIDGNDTDRLFLHYGGGRFTLRGLRLLHGADRTTGFHIAGGGCIASAGYLTLDHSVVADCYAGGEGAYGGAIYAYSLTMISSTLAGNTAYGVLEDTGTAAFGGAAFVYTLDLTDSTVTGNRAEHRIDPPRTSYDIGGGLMTVFGGRIDRSTIDGNFSFGRAGGIASFTDLLVSNSTLSGNTAQTEMGGGAFLRLPAALTLASSTVTANVATVGGGIALSPGGATFQSSIVFGNRSTTGLAPDLQSTAASAIGGTDNLVGGSGEGITLPDDTIHGDPMLAPLAFNGGATRTHALRPGSAAIDRGNNAIASAFDQRGPDFPRVYGAAADIGAFELSPQGAVAQTPVPTLSPWMLGLLGAGLGAIAARRRLRTARAR
ncbi:MAG TPA: IPTL-CTERM sorting domain-containing protein [Rhodanobacteraceae bacterium]|nr:IPTL-CTERM sorting domain-containing protein [Rhodanobacteraceae bacterium]